MTVKPNPNKPFKTPSNYFETFDERIQNRIKESNPLSYTGYQKALAFAASFAVLFGLGIWYNSKPSTPQLSFSSVTTGDLIWLESEFNIELQHDELYYSAEDSIPTSPESQYLADDEATHWQDILTLI